jgi:hypothetical protein
MADFDQEAYERERQRSAREIRRALDQLDAEQIEDGLRRLRAISDEDWEAAVQAAQDEGL